MNLTDQLIELFHICFPTAVRNPETARKILSEPENKVLARYDGDKLIVDRSIEPRDGHVVVAVVDGEMTVKRLTIGPAGVVLKAENPDYPDLRVAELSDFRIWGVATTCLHHL